MLGPEILAMEKRLSFMNIVMGIQLRREPVARRKERRKGLLVDSGLLGKGIVFDMALIVFCGVAADACDVWPGFEWMNAGRC